MAVGCSKDTALKQEDLKRILGVGIGIAGWEHTWKGGRGPYYRFFDLTAGPGIYRYQKPGEPERGLVVHHGSPVLAIDLLKKEHERTGLGFHAFFFDKTKKNLSVLKHNLNRLYGAEDYEKWINYIHGDYREKIKTWFFDEMYGYTFGTKYPSHPLGAVYCDTNGGCPDFHLMAELFGKNLDHIQNATRRIDLLLHLQIGILKRNCKMIYNKHGENKCSIDDCKSDISNFYECMMNIPKKYVFARECVDNKKKSTLVLFTNWDGYERKWKKHNFLNDKESREMLKESMVLKGECCE